MQKVVKSQMLAMCFYCKLNMNVITTENVYCICMGKTIRVSFPKNPHVFTMLHHFSKKRNKNVDIIGMFHHKMMGFSIHMLRAQERIKHCRQ